MTQAELIPVTAKERHASAAVPGTERKKQGMAAALEAERAEWIERVTFLAKVYLNSLPVGALFAIEDLRAYTEVCELPAPHSHKVWGSLPRALIAAGLPMRATDRTRKAHSPRTHAHRVSLWERT